MNDYDEVTARRQAEHDAQPDQSQVQPDQVGFVEAPMGLGKSSMLSQLDEELAKVDSLKCPDIADAFLLLRIRCGKHGWEKKDKQATEKVAADNNADPKAVSLSKNLLKGVKEVKKISQEITKARDFLKTATAKWDDGWFMVANQDYLDLYAKMCEYQQTIMGTNGDGTDNGLVYDLCEVYEFKRIDAQVTLGKLFNPQEYPDVEEVRRNYYFRIEEGTPSPHEPRIKLGRDNVEAMRERMKQQFMDKFNHITVDVYTRLRSPLKNMVERLNEDYLNGTGEYDKAGSFHNTLVTNVHDQIKHLRKFNMTGDPLMYELADRLEDMLDGVTSDNLKLNKSARIDTRTEAMDILNSLPTL